jgi:hypothetical protein
MLDASSSMPQLQPSIAPLAEQQPTAWTSDAPQATERVRRSAGDWLGWLFALALLAFFALFGFRMMRQALAGGWQWLWMPPGLLFAVSFSALTVLHVVLRLRERRRLRVALENLSLERGEGFRVGEPLEVRLLATVPEAHQGERTLAPARITVRLMRQFVRSGADGNGALVNECCDEAVVPCDGTTRVGKVLYACELCARPEHGGDASVRGWFVELHETATGEGAPFFVAGLRLLPAR